MHDLDSHSTIMLAPDLSRNKHKRSGMVGLVWRCLRRNASWNREQNDHEHLLALPDYLLEDVGTTRTRLVQSMRNRRGWLDR
jgi:hypothetical protein